MLELTQKQWCVLRIIAAIGAVNWALKEYNPSWDLVKQIFTDSKMQSYAYYAIGAVGALVIYDCLRELKVL